MTIATLIALFEDDIGTARTLLELLDHELEALTEADLPRLQSLLNQKQPLLAQLAQHATQRSQLLTAQQLSPDREGLATLAKRDAEAGAPLMETGDQLAALIEQCQAANQRNGRLIKANQVSTSQMVRLLRGSDTPALYDSKGGTARIGHQRPLSQA